MNLPHLCQLKIRGKFWYRSCKHSKPWKSEDTWAVFLWTAKLLTDFFGLIFCFLENTNAVYKTWCDSSGTGLFWTTDTFFLLFFYKGCICVTTFLKKSEMLADSFASIHVTSFKLNPQLINTGKNVMQTIGEHPSSAVWGHQMAQSTSLFNYFLG